MQNILMLLALTCMHIILFGFLIVGFMKRLHDNMLCKFVGIF